LAKSDPRHDGVGASQGEKVFVGHGGSDQWLRLEKYLEKSLGLKVEEYNAMPTAGMGRKERLQQMLASSQFALLVMTAEDEQKDETVRARQNVIHEVGLFQGRLGFEKAIVLLEEGCEEFSNIAGLDQIRFPQGRIDLIFDKVREVLVRESVLPQGSP
jgi:predicted nucleotide-binding protein